MATAENVMSLIERFCETPQTIRPEMMLDDLDIASINFMEIIISIEEEFGITVHVEDLQSLTTVQSVINYIERKPV